MASALESMVVDEKQLPEKPVDREKVRVTYNKTMIFEKFSYIQIAFISYNYI